MSGLLMVKDLRDVSGVRLFVILFMVVMVYGKTEVPVFLLSGQSNMVGMGQVSDLSSTQREVVGNVMINTGADSDAAKRGKWLTLGPGFGNTATNFGPELLFGRTLADSMPGQKIAIIKNAVNGAPLGVSSGYLPPSNGGNGGTYYSDMMDHIANAMCSFHEAFDTAEYTPRWAGFVWLQGETDAMRGGSLADNYRTNLENLVGAIRERCATPDLPVIFPLISTSYHWKEADKIRGADVALREELDNVDTVETKELNLLSDDMHYDAAGLIEIGYYAAIRWLDMGYDYRDPASVRKRRLTLGSENAELGSAHCTAMVVDISGRRIRSVLTASLLKSITPTLLVMMLPEQGSMAVKKVHFR